MPAASPSGAGSKGANEENIDIQKLSKDKIKQLMGRDPKFISRLITQLDKQMHNMMRQKQQRQEQIAADTEELQKLDKLIETHINPNLEKLKVSIKAKTELRDSLKKQLAEQKANLVNMQKEAASLITAVRSRTGKLMRATASQRLEEARGFSSTVPTSTLLKKGGAGKDGNS